jgi:hypothetical protein
MARDSVSRHHDNENRLCCFIAKLPGTIAACWLKGPYSDSQDYPHHVCSLPPSTTQGTHPMQIIVSCEGIVDYHDITVCLNSIQSVYFSDSQLFHILPDVMCHDVKHRHFCGIVAFVPFLNSSCARDIPLVWML